MNDAELLELCDEWDTKRPFAEEQVNEIVAGVRRLLREKQEAERMHVERKHIDATPDDGYPLRILSVYRADCDMRWADTSDGDAGNPLTVAMNEMQDKRAAILDRAIAALKEPKP